MLVTLGKMQRTNHGRRARTFEADGFTGYIVEYRDMYGVQFKTPGGGYSESMEVRCKILRPANWKTAIEAAVNNYR
jgi:hypothetical protein